MLQANQAPIACGATIATTIAPRPTAVSRRRSGAGGVPRRAASPTAMTRQTPIATKVIISDHATTGEIRLIAKPVAPRCAKTATQIPSTISVGTARISAAVRRRRAACPRPGHRKLRNPTVSWPGCVSGRRGPSAVFTARSLAGPDERAVLPRWWPAGPPHIITNPPSTASTWPVMYAASSDARNATA